MPQAFGGDAVAQRLTGQIAFDLVRNETAEPEPLIAERAGDMRRHQHVFERIERRGRRQRFGLGDIEHRPEPATDKLGFERRTIDLAELTLANFNGANYLKRLDGGAFEVTDESGPAIYGAPGKIVGSALEGSNTDIADEFTKLIVTQQAYSANTRVITTTNQMVQDLLNMLR